MTERRSKKPKVTTSRARRADDRLYLTAITLTGRNALAFLKALEEPPRLTTAQKELGKIMRSMM
jgi:hypothetical protein